MVCFGDRDRACDRRIRFGGRQRALIATSVFDDLSRPRYDKLWRISVLRVVVSFLFRTAILCLNAHGEIDGASSSDADCGAFITQENPQLQFNAS